MVSPKFAECFERVEKELKEKDTTLTKWDYSIVANHLQLILEKDINEGDWCDKLMEIFIKLRIADGSYEKN